MEIDKVVEQTKNWIGSRLKNPYFGSVIAVWVFTNRKIVFGLFNFESNLTLDQKILWVHQQLSSFKSLEFLFGLHGIEATIVWSLFWGYILMVTLNKVSGVGEVLYKWSDKSTINMIQKIEPSKWVEKKIYDEMEMKLSELETDLQTKKTERNRLEKENDSAIELLTRLKTENQKLMDEIALLKAEMEQHTNNIKIQDDTIQKLTIENQTNETMLKTLSLNTLEERKKNIKVLITMLPKAQFAKLADKQWIYKDTCLVHDYTIQNHKIASDTYRHLKDWEIQIFGRDEVSKQYLFNEMILSDFFPNGKNLEIKDNRIIWKRIDSEENIDTVFNSLAELLKNIEAYKASKEKIVALSQ